MTTRDVVAARETITSGPGAERCSGSALLLADGGTAASAPEFFRSREYLAAEGVTHSLLVDGIALPLIVRGVPGTAFVDAASPYGYPGGTGSLDAVDLSTVDYTGTGLVSLFVRDAVTGSGLRGGRSRGALLVHDPGRPRRVRRNVMYEVRANRRDGFDVVRMPGPAVGARELDEFVDIYHQTMRRTGAAPRYFFDTSYLRACLRFERSWLLTVPAREGAMAAAVLCAVSDGVLHYFLGGSSDVHHVRSPVKNAVVAMLDLADELALPCNLGGGLAPGDGLESFKRGFANDDSLRFVTHEVVCDTTRFRALAQHRETTFFPPYRANTG